MKSDRVHGLPSQGHVQGHRRHRGAQDRDLTSGVHDRTLATDPHGPETDVQGHSRQK